jgi:hypothetical protein
VWQKGVEVESKRKGKKKNGITSETQEKLVF